MSYEIFYKKAFIKVNDKYIPMVNSGANNCYDIDALGREIPEKKWYAYKSKSGSMLFTFNELCDLADELEKKSEASESYYRKRNVPFKSGEFKDWILTGIVNAATVEEYVQVGNALFLNSASKGSLCDLYTNNGLLRSLEEYKDEQGLNITFYNSRDFVKPTKKRKNPDSCLDFDRQYVCVSSKRIKSVVRISKRNNSDEPNSGGNK